MIFCFTEKDMSVVDESLHIAEDIISDFFSVTSNHWLMNQYEVRTMVDITDHAVFQETGWFAHLLRYSRPVSEKNSAVDNLDFYRICLNDSKILGFTENGRPDRLLPFLIYVLTHELVHIIRFSRFYCCPDVYDRREEEITVHAITRDILSKRRIDGMRSTLDFFRAVALDLDREKNFIKDNMIFSNTINRSDKDAYL
jgi:hypothetical protein